MATPGYVFTISHVAEMLGENEELLWEIGAEMFPEHGCLWVVDIGENGIMAFTNAGIDNLRESLATRESMNKK